MIWRICSTFCPKILKLVSIVRYTFVLMEMPCSNASLITSSFLKAFSE